MNILLLRIDKIGDFILSINPILQLKDSYHGCNIDLVVSKANSVLARSTDIFRKVIVIDNDLSKTRNILKFIRSTMGERYDYSVDLIHGTNHLSSILQLIAPARNKMGVPVGLRKYFLNKKVKYSGLKYETELVSDILHSLIKKGPRTGIPPPFRFDQRERMEHGKIKKDYALKSGNYACIYPIIEKLEKKRQWPLHKYAELIRVLLTYYPKLKIVITGSRDDMKHINQILEKIDGDKVINLAGKINLAQLTMLLCDCRFSLGGLTGPSHISAVICRKPTFCIVGGTTIRRWTSSDYPYIIIKKSPPCFPCEHLKGCTNPVRYGCLKDVSVKDVMGSIKENV